MDPIAEKNAMKHNKHEAHFMCANPINIPLNTVTCLNDDDDC
jgi:hypothetical protein